MKPSGAGMAPSVDIRPFRETDAGELRLCMIEEQDALRAFDPRMPPGAAMADAYLEQTLQACRDCDGTVFVAAADGRVVGFATVLARVSHAGADNPSGSYAVVRDLAVRSAWRDRGVGTALLRHAEDHVKASGAIELRVEVLSENVRADALYRRLGFAPYLLTLVKRVLPIERPR